MSEGIKDTILDIHEIVQSFFNTVIGNQFTSAIARIDVINIES